MRFITLIIIFLFSFSGFSQKSEIGLSIIDLGGINKSSESIDNTQYTHIKGFNPLKPVLLHNYINKNNTVLSIQVGYFYSPVKSDSKTTDVNKSYQILTGTSLRKCVYFKVGIAKRFEYEKFNIDLGINIPFEYRFYGNAAQKFDTYDSLHVLQYTYNYNDRESNSITTGVNLQTSFFYKLNKSFRLGIDLNTGIIFSCLNGKRTITQSYTFYNSNPPIAPQKDVYKYKFDGQLNLNMFPAITLRYLFSQRQKSNLK